VLLALLALPALVRAQNYEIKLHKDGKGDKALIIKEESNEMKFSVKGPDGKVLNEGTEKSGEVSRYTEEILEKEGDKKATKLRRVYEKAQVTEKGKTSTLPYEGKTVLIEKKGDKYVFSVDGKELTGDDARMLAKEFKDKKDDKDFEALMLPGKPVAVNDTWKIDAAVFAKDLAKEGGFGIDLDKATAAGKLLRAYKKDGRQYGVIEVKMTFPMQSLGEGAKKLIFQPGAVFQLTFLLDLCIDGSLSSGTARTDFTLMGNGVLKAEGQEFQFAMEGRGGQKETHESLNKK
jgi:hypothetical protein